LANTGIFGSFVVLDLGNGSSFYDLGSATDLPNFSSLNGATFGDGGTNSAFRLTGGELNTFKNTQTGGNGFNDVGTPSFLYSVTPGGADSNFAVPFNSEFGGNPSFGSTAGDQKWQTLGQNVNLLSDLAPGDYTVSFRITAPTGNNGTFSGGEILDTGSFNASITVVPEPSSVALLAGPAILGAWFYVRRRRA
jgi:hypothetical protein